MKNFDPWDWLGVVSGGFISALDQDILEVLEALRDGEVKHAIGSKGVGQSYRELICTLLCNTDAFEFKNNPTQLRFVGDDQFKTLDDLISAWDNWYERHYS